MTASGDRIGIIAGSGHLPLYIAHSLSAAGEDIYVAALRDAADPGIEKPDWETGWFQLYSLKKLLDGLRLAGARKVVLAGRVGHDEIFSTTGFDDLLIHFLQDLQDHRPSTILGGLVDLLAENGFTVIPLTDAAPDLLPAAGHLAGPRLERQQLPDLDFGWRIARGVADLDIGQSVLVKGRAVVAVEAMEGTDKTIERAGNISRGGLTLVKLAASHHDFRYDVPTVGPDTILRLTESGGNLIAVEAERSLVLDLGRISALCDDKKVTLIACSESEDGGAHWPEA